MTPVVMPLDEALALEAAAAQVAARAERAVARTSQDDDACGSVRSGPQQGVAQARHELCGQRVALLGAIEGQPGDPVGDIVEDGGLSAGHGSWHLPVGSAASLASAVVSV